MLNLTKLSSQQINGRLILLKINFLFGSLCISVPRHGYPKYNFKSKRLTTKNTSKYYSCRITLRHTWYARNLFWSIWNCIQLGMCRNWFLAVSAYPLRKILAHSFLFCWGRISATFVSFLITEIWSLSKISAEISIYSTNLRKSSDNVINNANRY